MSFFFLLIALIGLWLGAELVIRGSLDIAHHYRISPLFIGLTILAVGTDLPELFVNFNGAVRRLQGVETSGLIVGEIIGTVFSQAGLVLGIAGLLGALTITKREWGRDSIMMIISVALLFFLGIDGELSRFDGIVMIVAYGFYLFTLFREESVFGKVSNKKKPANLFHSITSIMAGMGILIYSSNLTITQSLIISENLGVRQSLVGIIMIGVGTSLPELVTTVISMRRKASAMAVGNIIGSNIFDLLFALGGATIVSGFLMPSELLSIDLPLLMLMSIIITVLFKSDMKIYRRESLIIISLYFAYIFLKIFTSGPALEII